MIYDKMKDCFASMKDKVRYAIDNTDLKAFFDALEGIDRPTIVTGLGGSSVVATFLAKVLREKNHVISTFMTPRDLAYMDLSGYENVICVSYSGTNLGVRLSFDNDLNKYLVTGNPRDDVNNIVYKMMNEISYVSINATVVPLSLLFLYYRNDQNLLFDILDQEISTDSANNQYEVMSGYETCTAATLLESSIIESGIGSCVIHDKYNYCHGRLNICKNTNGDLILFDGHNELDGLLKDRLKEHYGKIITIERKYDDPVIDDFYLSVLSLKLVHAIAANRNIEISDMQEYEDNDLFYRFEGKVK